MRGTIRFYNNGQAFGEERKKMTDEELRIITENIKPIQILETEESITLVFEKTGRKLKSGFHMTMVTIEQLTDGKYRVIGNDVMNFLSTEEDYEKNKVFLEKILEYFEVKQVPEKYGDVYRDIDRLDDVDKTVFEMMSCISCVQRWPQMFHIAIESRRL